MASLREGSVVSSWLANALVLLVSAQDDIDRFYEAVIASGASVIKELRNEPWGMREFGLRTGIASCLGVQAESPANQPLGPTSGALVGWCSSTHYDGCSRLSGITVGSKQ